MGRGSGRYTTMSSFGPPPMFFSLIMFSWLKPRYVFPAGGGGGPGPPPDEPRSRRVRYRSRDPFDLSLDTRETRQRRAVPPTERGFMAMAQNLEDLEEAEMRTVMAISEQDMGGIDKERMVREAIIHLRTENIFAEPPKVKVNSQGNCLPDCIVASLDPHVKEAHLKKLSRNLRAEFVFKLCEATKKATRGQLDKLADLSTGKHGAGRQTTREGLLSLLKKFGGEYIYMGEAGDMFTSLVAFARNRPVILVDVHMEREPTFSALHPDMVFKNREAPYDPIIIVRSGDHFEPLLLRDGQAAIIKSLYNRLRASDFEETSAEAPETETPESPDFEETSAEAPETETPESPENETLEAMDSDQSLPSPDRVANLWRYESSRTDPRGSGDISASDWCQSRNKSPKQTDQTERASEEQDDAVEYESSLEVLSSDDAGKETRQSFEHYTVNFM